MRIEGMIGERESMAIEFSYRTSESGGYVLLSVSGDVDFEDRKQFQEAVTTLFEKYPYRDIRIDISCISRIPSVFFGVLLDAGKKAQASERLLSAIMNPEMARIAADLGVQESIRIVLKK